MVVRCIKTSISNKDFYVINSVMDEYLKIDSMFYVYGIRLCQNKLIYIYIYTDWHLIEVPLEMFSIVDNSIPSIWKCKFYDNGDFTLWPELFYKNDFFENFSEYNKEERSLFEHEIFAEIEGR